MTGTYDVYSDVYLVCTFHEAEKLNDPGFVYHVYLVYLYI